MMEQLQAGLAPAIVVTTGLVPVVQGRRGISWIAGTSPAMTAVGEFFGLKAEVPAFAGMTPWMRENLDV